MTELPATGDVPATDDTSGAGETRSLAGVRTHGDAPAASLPGPSGWQRWAALFVPTLLWCGAASYLYSGFLAHPSRAAPGGPDGVLYTWYFEWVRQAITHLHNPLMSTSMNAPGGVNAMWNTSVILLAVLLVPLTATVGATATVGLVMVVSPVLSALSAYLVFRKLTGAIWASALCATFYGFGPFFIGQNAHLHLIAYGPLLPWVLYLGYRLFVHQNGSPIRTGFWLGLLVGCALLISEEMVTFTAVIAAVAVIILAALHPTWIRAKLRFAVIGIACALATTLIVTGVPLGYQFFGPFALHGGIRLTELPVDLASLIRPGPSMYFSSPADVIAARHFLANGSESTGYLGWALISACVAAFLFLAIRKRMVAYWWLLTAGSAIALSLGNRIYVNGRLTTLLGPWHYFTHIGLFRGATPARFSLITALLVATILAFGLAALRNRWLYGAGVVATALCLVPLIPSGPYHVISQPLSPRFFRTSSVDAIAPQSIALILPQAREPWTTSPVMYWQVAAHMRFRIIGGYSVFDRNGNSNYFGQMPAFAALLQTAGVTGIIPAPGVIRKDRATISSSGVRYVVITGYVRHIHTATEVAASLTGCAPHAISDVILCDVPRHANY